jgi:hypothetical protein
LIVTEAESSRKIRESSEASQYGNTKNKSGDLNNRIQHRLQGVQGDG